MKGKERGEQHKKIIFLAAVIAAGILIYVLFGRNPVEEEIITFMEPPENSDGTVLPAPQEDALIEAFEAVLPEENFRMESHGIDAAVYVFSEDEAPVTLTLELSSGRVTTLKMAFVLPKFYEPLSASATMVEKALREKRQVAFESAVTESIFRFQLLSECYTKDWPHKGQTGSAADAFREALLEGRSERVETSGWQYDLLSLRNSEEYTAEISVTYIGENDEE